MRFIGNDPNILDAFYKATASGSIAAGKPVIVTAPALQQGSESSAFDAQAHYLSAVYDTSNDKVVVAYSDPGDSNYGKAVVGTVSGSDITFGTPVVFESAGVAGADRKLSATFDSTNNKVVIGYVDNGNSDQGTAIVGTVSGTSISFGSATVFEEGDTRDLSATFDDVAGKVVFAYRDFSNSQYGTAIVGTVSGTSISFGTATVFESASVEYTAALAMPNWSNTSERRILIAYRDEGNGSGGTLITGTVSGTSISFGSARLFDASSSSDITLSLITSGDGINRAVCAYRDGGSSNNGKAFTVRAIDTTNNNESAYTFDDGSNAFYFSSSAYDVSQGKVLIVYRDQGNSNQGEFVFATPSANGEALTFTTPALFFENAVSGIGTSMSAVYDPDSEKSVVAYRKPNLNGAAKTIFNDPGGKVKAITETAVSQAIGTPAIYESGAVRSTSIAYDANAQKVVVAYTDNGNSYYGTAAVGTVSGTSISFGTPVVFESAQVSENAIAYDANAQKVVISYRDMGNSSQGTAIVGTVSGTSISFGSATVFETGDLSYGSISYDSTAQKVVIAYQDGSDSEKGKAVVGTISGTSISFGSVVQYESGGVAFPSIAYDSNADRHVIAYRDSGNSNYGTAVVGTVSGTSISFGTPVVFESAASEDEAIAYDSSAQKVVIAYKDEGNSNYGTAIVGTVSGTSISFGTAVVFESASIQWTSIAYDSSVGKVIVAYSDVGNSRHGTVVEGTVSGTSISFNTPAVFEDSSTYNTATAYDSSNERAVIAYWDLGDSEKGKAVVVQPSSTSTNLTSENYIGITDQAYTDGQDATIAVVGCIDRNQTSLTAGQQYFVQRDGTLALTAATPSVLAGTAISATELVVKE